jgi:hypothetical protein
MMESASLPDTHRVVPGRCVVLGYNHKEILSANSTAITTAMTHEIVLAIRMLRIVVAVL